MRKNRVLGFLFLYSWKFWRFFFCFVGLMLNGYFMTYVLEQFAEGSESPAPVTASSESFSSLIIELGPPIPPGASY